MSERRGLMSLVGGGGTSHENELLDGSLTEYENSTVTSLRTFALNSYAGLTSVSFPEVTSLSGQNHFGKCSNLASVSMPKLTQINGYTFSECQSLVAIPVTSFPLVTKIMDYGFTNCQHLVSAQFQSLTTISGNSFNRCFLLETLVLRSSTVCTLSNISAFGDTPFRGRDSKTGTLYVPSDLVASYKTANNWKTLYDNGTMNIASIEGSIYA